MSSIERSLKDLWDEFKGDPLWVGGAILINIFLYVTIGWFILNWIIE